MNNAAKKTEKQKVIERLIKWGWNPETAERITGENFEYVEKHYSGISKMAEVIASL
tara:strand:+ start:526 stop:693 length:168 start_codon:yes stop_codon:yes gene_type:complete